MQVGKSGQVPGLVYMGAVGHVLATAYAAPLVPARLTPLQVCVAASVGDVIPVLGTTTQM